MQRGGGGVLANRRLRVRLGEEADRRGVGLFLPALLMCTDNGAMIRAVGASARTMPSGCMVYWVANQHGRKGRRV